MIPTDLLIDRGIALCTLLDSRLYYLWLKMLFGVGTKEKCKHKKEEDVS
jgi:hypothetical protein